MFSLVFFNSKGLIKAKKNDTLMKRKERSSIMQIKKRIAVALAAALALSSVQVPAEAAKVKKVTKIVISNSETVKEEMQIGDTIRLDVATTPTKHDDTLKYGSSDKEVAVVSSKGNIRAVGEGRAMIKVKAVKGKVYKRVKVTVAAAPLSVKQTGDKTIELISGKDMLGQDIKVTKNGSVYNYEIEMAEDGKKAILTLANKIMDGEYTVTVGEESATFTGESGKETTIELLGENLAMDDYAASATKATIGYRVLNQYGEDITKKVSVQATCSIGSADVNSSTGVITVTGDSFKYLAKDTKVTMMLTCNYGTEIITEQREVILSDKPVMKTMEAELYSPEGSVLTDDFDGDDNFYLIFKLADQYGNEYREVNKDNAHVFDSMMINLIGGITNLVLEGASTGNEVQTPASELLQESIEVDGELYPAVRLAVDRSVEYASYGAASLNVYSYGGGAITKEIPVAYGTTIDIFRVIGSEAVVQGEDVEFEYEAYDAYGEPVTKLSAFRALEAANEELAKNFKFVKEGNVVRMYHEEGSQEELGIKYLNVITPNTKGVSTFQYSVMAAARPTLITGLKGIETGVIGKGSIKFMVKNFVIEDQYGRVMSNDDIYLHEGIYSIVPDLEGEDDFEVQSTNLIELSSGGYTNIKFKFENGSRPITFKIAGYAGQEINDLLSYGAGNVQNVPYDKIQQNLSQYSELTTRLTSSSVKNLNNFEVNKIEKIYYGATLNSGYSEEINVYGLSGTAKVKLSSDDYTVVVQDSQELEETNAKGIDGLVFDSGYNQLYSDFTKEDFVSPEGEIATELTRKVDIILNSTGEVVSSQEIKICSEEPAVTTARLKTKRGKDITELSLTPEQLENFSEEGGYLEELVQYIRFTDQYGASDSLTNASKPSQITDFDMSFRMLSAETKTGMISGNGTKTPSFKNFEAGDEIELEIRFSGGATIVKTISVI